MLRPYVWQLTDDEPLPSWVDPAALSPAERTRADRITHPHTRSQFQRGRLVMRAALASRLGIAPAEVPIITNGFGKPMLATGELHFNTSHTDGIIVFALASVPVGVDVERHRATRDVAGLMRRYFTPEEQEQFFALPNAIHSASFLKGWTCKEAVLKGVGTGLRDLARCVVDVDARKAANVVQAVPETGQWELEWLHTDGETAVALAWQTELESKSPFSA